MNWFCSRLALEFSNFMSFLYIDIHIFGEGKFQNVPTIAFTMTICNDLFSTFLPKKCSPNNIPNINVQIVEHYPTLNTGPVHLNISASPAVVLQCCSPLWGPRQSLCVSGLLLGHLRHAAVLQCLASVCYHTTAYWSLVCQGITSLCISTIFHAL